MVGVGGNQHRTIVVSVDPEKSMILTRMIDSRVGGKKTGSLSAP
jgi:hypothetical protein